jgi:DNA-binding transcriptional regulator YdaS (Cro superfamily)
MHEFTTTQRLDIASKCGIGTDYLYQVLTGRKVPSAEIALAIERATYALVTRKELRPDDCWRIWPDLAHLEPKQDAIKNIQTV